MASVPETQASTEKLSLYYRDWCGYCYFVKRNLNNFDVDVEIRDINKNPAYRNELFSATGRGTVPVLRREFSDGRTEWMPESIDIIKYLQENYSK